MKVNPFDQQRTHLVAGMKQASKQINAFAKDVTPYNSVKLKPEEERQTFTEPWRLFPGEVSMIMPELGHLTAAEAYSKALASMGPVKYVKWWDDNVA